MMRSLWTAASGMLSQQINLDTIANNLANINTVGYKKETTEFKTLLYQTLKEASTDSEGNPKVTAIQVGAGVRNSAITPQHLQGSLTATDELFDLGIQGDGFFMVQTESGETAYTRNGRFQIAIGGEHTLTLSNSDGLPVLSNEGAVISFSDEWNLEDILINESGQVVHEVDDEDGYTRHDIVATIGRVQFNNPAGLSRGSRSLLYATDASGAAKIEGRDIDNYSVVKQGYLEASNVQAADEMVNMIIAQRAYELNSKIITASDEMLQQANNLRR